VYIQSAGTRNSRQNLSTRRLDRVHRRRVVRNRLQPAPRPHSKVSCRSPLEATCHLLQRERERALCTVCEREREKKEGGTK
jgi:hypothetical protein